MPSVIVGWSVVVGYAMSQVRGQYPDPQMFYVPIVIVGCQFSGIAEEVDVRKMSSCDRGWNHCRVNRRASF